MKIYPDRFKTLLKAVFPTNRRLLVAKSLQALSLKQYQRILIVGAGNDPYRELFDDCLERYIRFDIQSYSDKTDITGDILDAPFEDESFDCIVLNVYGANFSNEMSNRLADFVESEGDIF